MRISQKGIDLIKHFEGFRAKPYLCPARIPTIGYGATYYADGTKVRITDNPISKEDAEALLRDHLKHYEKAVDRYTRDDITQEQFDALVSFAYNLGVSALRRSTLLKKVNQNPKDKNIDYQFSRWVRANGRVLKGLQKRRKAESKLYFS